MKNSDMLKRISNRAINNIRIKDITTLTLAGPAIRDVITPHNGMEPGAAVTVSADALRYVDAHRAAADINIRIKSPVPVPLNSLTNIILFI